MSSLPSGTVTFLFSDIEGSTKLWQQHPEAMQVALARHDALLRQIIESHDGYVFKTVGDEFCAAFPTALAALAAALAIQRGLQAADWAGGGTPPLRVRMGLHTGAADVRDGDYFGATLSRVARLMAAGHGGQTLLSAATQELVRDNLPADVTLRDMGERRLRDLVRSEQIFQLVAPDLPADFPPLRTLDAFPNNLPLQLTSFIGREKEMAEVKRLLAANRLVTLTGVGGTGKTRLSLQVAADLLDVFPDGVWLVELAPLADPALLPQAVAAALGLREEPGTPLMQTLVDALKPKRLLLLLDNCEHLVEACARLADALLRACPHLRLLASSREALGIAGEVPFHVPSLTLPDPKQLPSLESLSQYEAVRLFIDRATTVQPAFAVTNQNAPAVAQVCYRLDGIPLAIELAAARVRAMPVEQIAKRLDDRFRLLTGGSRTALPRQQTLAALIDWSYNLLTGPERVLLRRLSVFAGGWSMEAAEQVCADVGQDSGHPRDVVLSYNVLDLLTRLVDKSLVVAEEREGEARYRLLETIRQYAGDKLLESGEGEALRNRHLDYFLRMAEESESGLHGPGQMAWLQRLETEHDNLRVALRWSVNSEGGCRLAGALVWFWRFHSHEREGGDHVERLLAQTAGLGRTAARAKALWLAHWLRLDGTHAKRSYLDESIAIYREVGDKRGLALALRLWGWGEFERQSYDAARATWGESRMLMQEVGDEWGLAYSLCDLGDLVVTTGDLQQARAYFEESVRLFRKLGDELTASIPVSHLGFVDIKEGNYAAAKAHFAERLAISRVIGGGHNLTGSIDLLGTLMLQQGALSEATALFTEGLALARETGNMRAVSTLTARIAEAAHLRGDQRRAEMLIRESLAIAREVGINAMSWGMPYILRGMAGIALAQGRPDRAVRLFAAVDASLSIYTGVFWTFPANYQQDLAAARAHLGDAAFAAAWAEGREMSLEQAIAYALEEAYPPA